MKPESPVISLVRHRLRRLRVTPLIWSAAAVLVAHVWTWAARLGWLDWSEHWAFLPAALAAVILGWWLRRTRHLKEENVARELDEQWKLRSQLETAVELARDESALAEAQRSGAVRQIAGRETVGTWVWRGGVALLVAALAFLATEAGVVLARMIRVRAAVVAEIKKAEEAHASIVWKTPEAEITATAIEEVPLTAYAESSKGFRSLSLEVDVNGERAPSRPLDAAAWAKPGGYDLEASLYLDELKLKPFDVVSYHLVGVPNMASTSATVVSPLQFIQIRPPRRDMALQGSAGDMTLVSMIRQMKGAQMKLLQQTFTLLHADAVKEEIEWKTANARVATEQAALAGEAGKAHLLAVTQGAPGLVTGNLTQAETLMKEAGARIAKTDDERAITPQRKAIALLAELEQLINQAASGGAPVAADPFQDLQRFEIPKREATPAGELEKLASRQKSNNQGLEGAGGGGTGGDGAAKQDAIARDAEKLAEAGELDPAVQKELKVAAASAAQAARQLKANDRSAAREPAAEALAGFEQAIAMQNKSGNATTLATLDQMRRALNAASRENGSARAATLTRVQSELSTAAIQQQRTGSADAAQWLAQLAGAVNAPKGAVPEVPASDPNTPERAREIATAMAHTQILLSPRAVALSRTVRGLRHVPLQLVHGPDSGAAGFADAELAGQEGEWLTTDKSITENSRQLTAQSDGLQRGPGKPGAQEIAALVKAAETLANALERVRDVGQRDEIVRRFSAEEIDPEYRQAVEAYFERLSRNGAQR